MIAFHSGYHCYPYYFIGVHGKVVAHSGVATNSTCVSCSMQWLAVSYGTASPTIFEGSIAKICM